MAEFLRISFPDREELVNLDHVASLSIPPNTVGVEATLHVVGRKDAIRIPVPLAAKLVDKVSAKTLVITWAKEEQDTLAAAWKEADEVPFEDDQF